MWKLNKKIKLLEYKFKKNLWADLLWLYKTNFKWQWMEFAELREYVYWDPIKHVDWKTTARTGKMQTRIYEEERDLNVLFLLDISDNMNFWSTKKNKKNVSQEVFYSLAYSAIANNDNIWSLFYNDKWFLEFINFKKWISQIYKIIEKWDENIKINNKEKKSNYTLDAFKKISDLKLKRNLIFVLTTDTSIENSNILKLVWEENEIIYINIFDYFENNLEIPWIALKNIELNLWINNSILDIDLTDKKKILEYKKIRNKRIWDYKIFLEKNKVLYLKIDNIDNSYNKLLEFFSKR